MEGKTPKSSTTITIPTTHYTPSPPTTIASSSASAKTVTNPSSSSPKIIREDGELFASENDELAGPRLPNSTILPAAPSNKDVKAAETGISALTNNSTRISADSKTSVQLNNRKGTEKNRVPFVISFSDDDSGSESEEYVRGNKIESVEMTRGVTDNRKSSTSMGNSQMWQQAAKTNKQIPKKRSMTRIFAPSTNRVNATLSNNGGSSSVGAKTHLKKSNPPSKNKLGPNVHVNSNKVQDLRQLIAIRENELKSRSDKPDKEAVPSSLKNSTNMKAKNVAVRTRDSAERVFTEPKEPEHKRLKLSEPPTNAPTSAGQHDKPPSESTGAGTSALDIDGLNGRYDGSYCDKEILGGTRQTSSLQQTKEVKNYNTPSMNPPSGANIIRNNSWHNNNLVGSSAQLTAITSPPRQGPLNNSSIWNHLGTTKMLGTGEMDMKSLLEIEELQDKELDEAQEHRRRCEIEERNALKAYRKAQRALAEANARCTYLFHKRDSFSANLRSHVMDDSSMYWPNMPHLHTRANVNSITNMVENHLPQMQNEFHQNVRPTDDLHEDGKNLVSESCGDPDISELEPHEEEKTNDVSSSLHENNNTLAEDERASVFALKVGDTSHWEGSCSGMTEVHNDSMMAPNPNEDSLLLEATLRSQLFARLGARSSKKNDLGQSIEPTVDDLEDGEIMEDSGNTPFSETERDQLYDIGDIGRSDKSLSEYSMGTKEPSDLKEHPINYGSSLAEPILRSGFGHVKFADIMRFMPSETGDVYADKRVVDGVCGVQPTDLVSGSKAFSLLDMHVTEVGSYSCNLAINPFWPLCMFELRGKCNDDECDMQHIRDYSSKSIDCNRNDNRITRYLGSLTLAPPTYVVCLDSLKDASHPYKYFVAQTVEQRWQKYYSAFLVGSSSLLADLNSDEPCLHGPETRIEVHGVWNRQSSYFHGKHGKESLSDQHMDDTYQPLEVALYNLSREVNKQKGRKEALIVLARALEEHPASVLLWNVYLHIYYSNQKLVGKDDLFRYAVEHNETSYELWLMFINSRERLNDRLSGYDAAISALCRHVSAPERNARLDSECILDLFLQMMSCLCSSGQVDNAIQKAYTLLSSTKRSCELTPLFLPDLYKSLTVTAKCVLWISCIYLILYKKLPDTVVRQFECPKELSAIEWHFVQLTPDEKLQAVTLMELASEFIDSIPEQSKRTLKSAERFALNHIKCAAVLEGFYSSKILLKKYIELYPSCMELVLLSIRVNGFDSTESTYAAFEEVISNWIAESGVQCIWNQYAQYALETGNVDLAKDTMERWFSSISEDHHPKTNVSAWISMSTQTDIVFGLLNLSLHNLLQNDLTEARIAIEQVFEVASSDYYNHCVREHATFLLRNSVGFGKASFYSFLNSINRYLMDPRVSPLPDPLSRSFIKSIKKPKTQKIVNNLLCPISSDSALLNLVLESCYGSLLLPLQASERLTDAVDFAEALMEIRPANYQLALSICKNQFDVKPSISFWASAQLIDSLFQAVPVAPESVWVEAAGSLKIVPGLKSMLESFHRRALSVYPFSVRLWKSYLGLFASNTEKANAVVEMARKNGIKL
uniref:uncharacterized protein LOC122586803 n=1 Tax=Erigeron canadensis TaxID=72917 RepID=UPI001CB99477|nr:uncharacterized protein LOC122586803 [Erigeron canadensis]